MKLWRIAQWGNPKEGPNGHDTQCVISAVDMKSALDKATELFGSGYQKGQADFVMLMGTDPRPKGEAVVVIVPWVAPAFNLAHDPGWLRHPNTRAWVPAEDAYEAMKG